jgi:hypothetical protein
MAQAQSFVSFFFCYIFLELQCDSPMRKLLNNFRVIIIFLKYR